MFISIRLFFRMFFISTRLLIIDENLVYAIVVEIVVVVYAAHMRCLDYIETH